MLAGRFADLEAEVESAARNTKTWDLHGISSLDGAGAVLLWRGWSHRRPMQLRLRAEHEAIFTALAAAPVRPPPRRERTGGLPVTRALLRAVEHGLDATRLAGQLAIDGAGWLRHPGRVAWRETSANIYRAGAWRCRSRRSWASCRRHAVSYLLAPAAAFGADVFIVNMLGIGILRELGPLLAAILIAGPLRIGDDGADRRDAGHAGARRAGGDGHFSHRAARAAQGAGAGARDAAVSPSGPTRDALSAACWRHARSSVSTTSQFLRALPDVGAREQPGLGLGKGVVFGALIALSPATSVCASSPTPRAWPPAPRIGRERRSPRSSCSMRVSRCCSPTWAADDDGRDRGRGPVDTVLGGHVVHRDLESRASRKAKCSPSWAARAAARPRCCA